MTKRIPLYHITHLDNLEGIVSASRLWCDAQRNERATSATGIAFDHNTERLRRTIPVSARGTLGDYVSFSFCPRSVLLNAIHTRDRANADGQNSIVHCVTNVDAVVATTMPWAFSDRDPKLPDCRFFESLDDFSALDWRAIRMRHWETSDEVRRKKQAEFLVYQWLPWHAIDEIGVKSRKTLTQVQRLLEANNHRPRVAVRPTWYY